MIHKLTCEQIVPADIETCWEFFSNPANLARITPDNLGFQIRGDPPSHIYPGLMIEYRVRPLFGIPLSWLTEITYCERPRYFCDEQRVGPYAIWHHEHFFEPLDDGRVRMRDLIHYQLPLSPLSECIHPLLVAPQLRAIFDYRKSAVEDAFGPAQR